MRRCEPRRRSSKRSLKGTVDLFAYPFGKRSRHFNQTTIELVRSAGYSYAAAVLFRAVRPSDSPFELPRFFTTGDSVADLADKVLAATGITSAGGRSMSRSQSRGRVARRLPAMTRHWFIGAQTASRGTRTTNLGVHPLLVRVEQ